MPGNEGSLENALSLIGFSSIRESLILFFVFGLLIMGIGGVLLDLTKDLPDTYAAVISEPIAFKIFIGMGGAGFLSVLILAVCKGEDFLKKPFVTAGVLAMSRTGLVAGAIITGMFLGLAGALFFLAKLGDPTAQTLAADFFMLFLEAFMFLSILTIPHLFLLIQWGRSCPKLYAWTGVVSAFSLGIAVGAKLSGMGDKTVIELGFLSASCLLACLIVHWAGGRSSTY